MAKQVKKAPVSVRAIIQRIGRKLPEHHQLKKSKGARCKSDLGDYYIVDENRKQVTRAHVDLEECARELGCLAEWETVVEE